jgi:hypothetical protein
MNVFWLPPSTVRSTNSTGFAKSLLSTTGSTDNSRAVIARYPILIFLDADDMLLPHAAATVAGRWTAGTVKPQSPVITIAKAGRPIGTVMPKYPPNLDTSTFRRSLLRTGCSFLSPSSGNAYSRALLKARRWVYPNLTARRGSPLQYMICLAWCCVVIGAVTLASRPVRNRLADDC